MSIDSTLFRLRRLRGWRSSPLGGAARILVGVACWLPVVVYFNEHIATVTSIKGPSMYPYFNEDRNQTTREYLTLNWRWNPHKNLKRGMVVTFYSPYDPEKMAVKRIIAIEGDVVRTRPPAKPETVEVPPGHIWVQGAAGAGKSLDSDTYGPISVNLVTGRLTHILHPWERFGPVVWPESERRR